MTRIATLHPPEMKHRGKHVPSMLILGPLGPMRKEMIPALFRIAGDHEIRHVDITQSPDALDPERLNGYALIFVAFDYYKDHETFFSLLPESLRSRVTVLARPSDFPAVQADLKRACFCSGLKALLPREEAQVLDHHHSPEEPR
jgi:hypothetical protein